MNILCFGLFFWPLSCAKSGWLWVCAWGNVCALIASHNRINYNSRAVKQWTKCRIKRGRSRRRQKREKIKQAHNTYFYILLHPHLRGCGRVRRNSECFSIVLLKCMRATCLHSSLFVSSSGFSSGLSKNAKTNSGRPRKKPILEAEKVSPALKIFVHSIHCFWNENRKKIETAARWSCRRHC